MSTSMDIYWAPRPVRAQNIETLYPSIITAGQQPPGYPVDIEITTSTSPALDIAAWCLDSRPEDSHSDSNLRLLPGVACQLTTGSLL